MSYTSQNGPDLVFSEIRDAALVNVTKLMQSNPNAYRSLTRPVVTYVYILMGISRRLSDSPQSHVRLQAQDVVKRWETSGEWKVLGSIMKTHQQLAKTPAFNIDSNNKTFQFEKKTFILPQMNASLFNQGVIDNVRFSRAFAKHNVHHLVSKSAILTVVGHFAVHHFPDTAAKIFINFTDQLRSPNRPIALEYIRNRSGIQEMNFSNESAFAPATTTCMTSNACKTDDQTRTIRISKGSSSNLQSKTHVLQRLGLLPSTHLRNAASRHCSILASLPLSFTPSSCVTHVRLVRAKISNGTMLCQIEVVTNKKPSLLLSCRNTAHRDRIFQRLADRNMNHGRGTAVTLSVERVEDNKASASAQWFLPIEFNDSNFAIFETVQQFFRNTDMIPESDLIEKTEDTAIKRKVLVIYASSDPWLKKYAMTEKGLKNCTLYAESVGFQVKCCICQETVQEHQPIYTDRTSNQWVNLPKILRLPHLGHIRPTWRV